MQIFINDREMECPESTSLAELVQQQFPQTQHIAAALNEEVVPKNLWDRTELKEGDRVLIIKATKGG